MRRSTLRGSAVGRDAAAGAWDDSGNSPAHSVTCAQCRERVESNAGNNAARLQHGASNARGCVDDGTTAASETRPAISSSPPPAVNPPGIMQALMTCLVAGSQYLVHPHELVRRPPGNHQPRRRAARDAAGDARDLRGPGGHAAPVCPLRRRLRPRVWRRPGREARLWRRRAQGGCDEARQGALSPPWSRRGHGRRGTVAIRTVLPARAKPASGVEALRRRAWRIRLGCHSRKCHKDGWVSSFRTGRGVQCSSRRRFRAVASLSEAGTHKSISVPSRLYHRAPSSSKPLGGIRVSVPDAVSLRGVQTTLSSRAWRSLHAAPADATAVLARRLLDLGAVIVGKSKSSQFASGREWVDEEAPWNPREDGYQRPLGGAAGAATAMAGYEWLKTAFGFDGIGGVREAAAAQGLYSLRTTPGDIPLAGSQISSPTYDSVGLVSRDVLELFNIASAALNQSHSNTAIPPPKRLVYPVDFFESNGSKDDKEFPSQFVEALENFLGFKADRVNVAAVWRKQPPPEAKGQDLREYMNEAPFRSLCYEFYHEYDEFREAYRDKFRHAPYAEATTQHRWSVGKAVTKRDHDKYQQRIGVFRTWFGDHIGPIAESGDSWTAVVLPFDSAAPKYRDESFGAPPTPHGVTAELLPVLLQTPQMVVPFAQLPYESRISGRREYHPVCGSVMGPRGGDLKIIHLVRRALETAQWRTRVDTGRFAFPVADNARNVDDGHVPGSNVSSHEARTSAGPWGEL
ncbi:Glutamyl-tRNA(Gln) amidotransferase subunit A [Tolypocladium capitatum]|uniref:Glutamyl-tRNA(Gln) amidotransferase subunit A n=1 Tax=Tolypocladium capitatum TaxID=45235 RepID=A0A2K3Q8B4_9HYPO|nr:Glutamyl-tRNA(Gln) amidotransferase subunit A [Tolypocladium capitatum]